MAVEGGGTDCTDGAVIVPIEKTIPHPEYKPYSARQRNDIALIRLDRVVEYTGNLVILLFGLLMRRS